MNEIGKVEERDEEKGGKQQA